MRITQSYIAQQFAASQDASETALAQLQQEISSGLAYSAPSQNPIAATQVLGIQATLGQITQYGANINLATSRLNLEDSTLTSVTNTLQSIRSLALQAANGTTSPTDAANIAAEIKGDAATLLQAANTQDGTGQYLFGGTATNSAPFVLNSDGSVSYVGNQAQRLQQIGADATVADGDSGAAVFQNIPNGNGTFVTSAGSANTGSGVIGTTSVTSASAWAAGSPPYTLTFADSTPPSGTPVLQYTVTDSTGATVIAPTNYSDGQSITINGAQLTLSGTPNSGDTFTVAASSSQSIFTTLSNLVTALQTTSTTGQAPLLNSINRALESIDQTQAAVGAAQTAVGSRLQTLQTQTSSNSSLSLQLTSAMSSLQDADYTQVATSLTSQMTALQAAQASYAKIAGLSLFNYIQ